MAKLRYLGHSAFYLEGDSIKALIDPFFAGSASAAKAEDFTELDYIFVTHGHGDHVGSTVEIAKRTHAAVFAPTELAAHFASQGLKTEGLQIGGRASFPFGRVKLTAAFHGSPMLVNGENRYAGLACGYVIEVEGKKIYHAGDTGLTVEMSLLEEENIVIACLPIGGYYTMDAEDAVRALGMIKPDIAIPMHYNTFPAIKADPEKFASLAETERSTVKVLAPGEEIEF